MSRAQQQIQRLIMQVRIHVWHHHKKTFFSKLVRLALVVGRMDPRPIGEEEQQLRGQMRVVARLRDIHLRHLRFMATVVLHLDEEAHTSISPSVEISCVMSAVYEACLEMEIVHQSILLRCLVGCISPSSGGRLSTTHLVVYP